MTGLVFGRDDAGLQRELDRRKQTVEALRQNGLSVGTPNLVVYQIG
jgi:hypothetical protein